MNKKITILFFLFLFSFLSSTHAQTLKGKITDAETNLPLEAVMISVLRGNTMIDYALTDAKGQFSLPWKHSGTLQLNISLLGYKREMRNINAAGTLNLSLQPEAIVLKEVQIRPGRINTRKDTVRYDLAQFASSKDVHIKDVLKKLPGVDVDENGQVKYKGKAIDHYFVEGMDVTGGRYNQINNNLSAKAVKTAEIINELDKIPAIELNISCPNVKQGGMAFGVSAKGASEVVKAVRSAYKKTLIVKLSPNVTDITEIARAAEESGADSVSLINTLLGMAIDAERKRPILSTITGGMSGAAVKPIALRMVWQVAKVVNIPVIGLGGIMDWRDAVEFILAGATAIQIGTANFIDPAVTIKVEDGINNYLERHGCKSVKEIIGALEV